jgi:hypothetical protein
MDRLIPSMIAGDKVIVSSSTSKMGEEFIPHRWRRSSKLDDGSPSAKLVRNLSSNSPAQSVHQPRLWLQHEQMLRSSHMHSGSTIVVAGFLLTDVSS